MSADKVINVANNYKNGLLINAGVTDNEFINTIRSVEVSCYTCQSSKEPAVCPVVGFSIAENFNQTVAMDLKPFRSVHFLTL